MKHEAFVDVVNIELVLDATWVVGDVVEAGLDEDELKIHCSTVKLKHGDCVDTTTLAAVVDAEAALFVQLNI